MTRTTTLLQGQGQGLLPKSL